MPEKWDFSKIEEQKKFDTIPKKDKDEIVGEAQVEAAKKQKEINLNKADKFVGDSDKKINEKETSLNSDKKKDIKNGEYRTIEIPGFGEIRYFEKTVMFPEHIIKETGGVKGYIKKTIDTEELIGKLFRGETDAETLGKVLEKYNKSPKFSDLTEKEQQIYRKFIDGKDEHSTTISSGGLDFFRNKDVHSIALKLTDGNFPDNTFNHVFSSIWAGLKDYDYLTKNRILLQKIFNPIKDKQYIEKGKIKSGYVCKGDKILFEIPSAQDISTFKLYLEKGKLTKEQINDFLNIFSGKRTKINKYFITTEGTGLSVSNKGKLWGDSNIAKKIYFGFSKKNSIFAKYLNNISYLYNRIKIKKFYNMSSKIEKLRYSESEKYWKYLEGNILKMEHGDESEPLAIGGEYYDHPRIPIVIGNPSFEENGKLPIPLSAYYDGSYKKNDGEIPELRWCHAAYGSIFTKKGWHIIEMIT